MTPRFRCPQDGRAGRGLSLALCVALSACGPVDPFSVRDTAQPDAPPLRTVTSFTESLQCLDQLLAASGRAPVILSSSEFYDSTRRLNVGVDDMLVNAISQINRRSGAYIFLDQVRTRKDGMVDLMIAVPDREPRPQFYIRGSISQLDDGVQQTSIGLEDVDDEISPAASGVPKSEHTLLMLSLHPARLCL